MSGDVINVGLKLATVGSFTVAAAGVPAIIVGVGAAAAVTAIGYGLYKHISREKVDGENKSENLEPVNFEWQDIAINSDLSEVSWSDLSINLDSHKIEFDWSNMLENIDLQNILN